jgi:TRAP-type uncharacterized transport system substrate-binding protein
MKKHILALALMISTAAFAAPAADAPAADCEGVKVATGPKGKGYSTLFADLKKILGGKVAICEVNTAGGLDNLNALSTKEADIGFVQIDTWNDMKNGDENIAALQYIMPMNSNYLHVVTSVNGFNVVQPKKFFGTEKRTVMINTFSDLRGQRVALVGSAQLLGRKLDKQLGFNMTAIDAKSDAEAFDMVKKGQVAAAFTVSGWPSGTVRVLGQADGLTLVPFNVSIGEPYKVKPLNYKNIAVYNNNSLGIPNVLVTRPFTGQRAANVTKIQEAIVSNLTELKEGNFQPAWNEVNPNAPVSTMTKFRGK